MKNKESFVSEFLEELNRNDIENWQVFTNQLCDKSWYKPSTHICLAIPWVQVNGLKLKLKQIKMLDHEKGFVLTSGEHDVDINFSLLKYNEDWSIDIENSLVWNKVTKDWQKISLGMDTITSFRPLSKEQKDAISSVMIDIKKWTKAKVESKSEHPIDFMFGYDQYESENLFNKKISELKPIGGSARGHSIFFTGDYNVLLKPDRSFQYIYSQSVIAHEVSHEFTMLNAEWGFDEKGLKIYNSLLYEGLAMHVQIEYLLEHWYPENKSDYESSFKFIERIEKTLDFKGKSYLDLLSDTKFREFNSVNGIVAYIAGAGLSDYLIKQEGIEGIRKTWLEINREKDEEKVKKIILTKYNEDVINIEIKKYIHNVLKKFKEKNL